MQDAWRAYLELALGVTEASRKKAQKVAQKLVGKGGATASQIQTFTEDLLSAGSTNREALTKLVRAEVDRTLGRVGLASADEVAALTRRVQELEAELRDASARAASAEAPERVADTGTPAAQAPAAQAPAAQTPGADAPAKKAVVKKATAKKAAAPTATVKKTTAKKTAAKKTAAKKTAAKKTAAAKTAAAKTAAAKTAEARIEPGGAVEAQ